MEFVEAMGIMNRMCKIYKACVGCPIEELRKLPKTDGDCFYAIREYSEKAEAILAKWNAEHPVNTRKQVLLKRFPNAMTDKDGTPIACSLQLGLVNTLVCRGKSCSNECKKCWNQPYEEE